MNSTWHRRLCACRRSASHSDRISKSDCVSIVNDMMAERAPGHFQFVNLHCTWAWPVLGRAEHIASSQWKECSGRRTVVSGQWTIGRRPRWRPLRPELSSSAATWRCWSPSDTKPPSPLCSVCVCVCAEYKYFNESSLLPVDFHNCDPGSGGQLLAALPCSACLAPNGPSASHSSLSLPSQCGPHRNTGEQHSATANCSCRRHKAVWRGCESPIGYLFMSTVWRTEALTRFFYDGTSSFMIAVRRCWEEHLKSRHSTLKKTKCRLLSLSLH